jgi:hypothetical protein
MPHQRQYFSLWPAIPYAPINTALWRTLKSCNWSFQLLPPKFCTQFSYLKCVWRALPIRTFIYHPNNIWPWLQITLRSSLCIFLTSSSLLSVMSKYVPQQPCSQIYSLCETGRSECEGYTIQTLKLQLCDVMFTCSESGQTDEQTFLNRNVASVSVIASALNFCAVWDECNHFGLSDVTLCLSWRLKKHCSKRLVPVTQGLNVTSLNTEQLVLTSWT